MVPTLLETVNWNVKHLHKQQTHSSEVHVSGCNSIFVGSHYFRRIHFFIYVEVATAVFVTLLEVP